MAGEELDTVDFQSRRITMNCASAADMDSNESSGGHREGWVVWEAYVHLVVETDDAPESTKSLGHMQKTSAFVHAEIATTDVPVEARVTLLLNI